MNIIKGLSLPSRGAWIEIVSELTGEQKETRRSPHGERGLKLGLVKLLLGDTSSLPSRGAWIEICKIYENDELVRVAPLTGSVD